MLRPAQPGDAPAIRALVRAARLDPTQLRWSQFWVVAQGGEVIACGQLRAFPGAQELGSLVVAPAWQGHGLGSALMRRLVQAATGPLYLECRAHLVPYYTRFGFLPVAWHAAPGPLKGKFALSRLAGTLFHAPIATMYYPLPAAKGV